MGGTLRPLSEKSDGLGGLVLLMEAVGLPVEEAAEGRGVCVSASSALKVGFGFDGAFLDAQQPTSPEPRGILPNGRGLKKQRAQEGVGLWVFSTNEQGLGKAELFVGGKRALRSECLEGEDFIVLLE